MDIKKELKKYEKMGFDEYQLLEIREWLEKGLDAEFNIFVTPKFNELQIREIRKGFENGLAKEYIGLYARIEYDWLQMRAIREGLKNGLTIDKVQIYAKLCFNWGQMLQIRYGLNEGLNVLVYANPNLSEGQTREIREYLTNRKEAGLDEC